MGCVLAFGILEVFFRLPVWLDDPLLPWFKVNSYIFDDQDQILRYAPGASGMHLRWDGKNRLIHINAEGRRGERIPVGEEFDILLGDSVIFNGGVEDVETLEALINAKRPTAGKRKVLNYGVSGSALFHYRSRLEYELAHQQQLKRVYICFYLNDFIRDAIPPFLKSQTRGPVMPVYDYHSYAIAHFGLLIRSAIAIHTYVPAMYTWVEEFHSRSYQESPEQWSQVRQMAHSEWGSAWVEENWQEFDQSIEAMARLCRKQSVEIVLVLFPVELQVSPEFINEEMVYPQEQAKALAEKWNVPVIDLLTAFRNRKSEVLFFDHCHLTPAGNRVAAEEIHAFINSNAQKSTAARVSGL